MLEPTVAFLNQRFQQFHGRFDQLYDSDASRISKINSKTMVSISSRGACILKIKNRGKNGNLLRLD